MKMPHQYELTISCDAPMATMFHGPAELKVFTVRGDYETVSKALGSPGSDVRDQLDRFEAAMNADDGYVSG
jgi:hypothetical protein